VNILWLSHLVPYPPKGGVLQRSFNLIKEVTKYHSVDLLAFNQEALLGTPDSVEHAIRQMKDICNSVKVVPIPSEEKRYGRYWLYLKSFLTPSPYTINWLRSREMEQQLKESLAGNKVDVVHFDTISLAPYRTVAHGYKTVLNHHNIESEMMLRRSHRESNPVKKLYLLQEGYKLRRTERQVCRAFDLNITCSSVDSERLRKMDRAIRVKEIPNGVDVGYFVPLNLEKARHSLVFAGGMTWYPNREAMLFLARRIWPLLTEKVPDVGMTVVGRAPPQELLMLAQSDQRLRVTGFVDDVRPYIDTASVYVCPIQDGGGTRLKILDALAMGKPIVAHPIAVEGIDVEPEKHVLIARTPEEFVRQIVRLFEDPSLYRRLAEEGRRLVEEKYDFREIGATLIRAYNQVVENRVA
jgi:sugar transferase (PEP-CTERM/EpsH1 system associated)